MKNINGCITQRKKEKDGGSAQSIIKNLQGNKGKVGDPECHVKHPSVQP